MWHPKFINCYIKVGVIWNIIYNLFWCLKGVEWLFNDGFFLFLIYFQKSNI